MLLTNSYVDREESYETVEAAYDAYDRAEGMGWTVTTDGGYSILRDKDADGNARYYWLVEHEDETEERTYEQGVSFCDPDEYYAE